MGVVFQDPSTTQRQADKVGDAADAMNVIRSYAPATGELLGEVPVMGASEVRAVVERARRAQQAWGLLPVEERCERLLRFRDALVDRAEEVVETLSRETGKPRHEALLHELLVLANIITHLVQKAPKWLAPREIPLSLLRHRRSYVTYAPRGVIGIISPWNYPLFLAFGDAVAAMVTGSAAVVKPSEVTPLGALKAKEIWDSTGLPEDLLGIVTGYGETGAALIDSGIQKMVFTGSVATGRRVAAACAERLIPCVLELGGKAPLIACEDADLERTARAIVFGGFSNSGQACISVERVYAHEKIHDRLVERVVSIARGLTQGDSMKDFFDVGAIIFPRQIEVVEGHIRDAVAKGALVELGGKRVEGTGHFFEPTVLVGCDHRMTVMTEEIFGPIVPFMKVSSEEEAIRLANDSHLALNAYVFTKDRDKGRRIAERIEAGSVLVNDVLANGGLPEVPFGGFKQSGWGRRMGKDAVRDLAEIRHINYDRIRSMSRDPIWYPYTAKSYRWFTRGLRAMFSGGGFVQRISELL